MAGAFTVEASLLGGGGIGTGEQLSLRDEPGGCPDRWPGGARRRGGASLVCGVRMERRRASADMAASLAGAARGMLASAGWREGLKPLPGWQSDRLVVVLILLPGAVGRGAKGPACSWLCSFRQPAWLGGASWISRNLTAGAGRYP